MAHILVTGAAGFIGSHSTDQLLRAGHRVTGVDNFRTGHAANLTAARTSAAFALHELDLTTPGALAKLATQLRPDAILHLAALVSVPESMRQPDLNFSLNLQATHEVAEAARLAGVPRVVFASSAAVYGNHPHLPLREDAPTRPVSPYGAAKLAGEVLLLGHAAAFGFTVRCQRYYNVFGPRQDPASSYSGAISIFARSYREGKAVTVFGDGRQTRDFISVHDVARANVLATTRPGLTSGIANICTGRGTSLLDVLDVFARANPNVPHPQHAPARPGDVQHSIGAPDAAEKELGFVAEVSVAQGLRELIGR
ncbi:MAG: NAD-dependent epimerase/dehydratase family protein [Opitutaceae bacterium]|nr:NAD-dependent epimerase/dehydratase family protein [Opitutaceae bacterium]